MKKVKAILFSTLLSFVITFILMAAAALITLKVGVLPERMLSVILMLICCFSVGAGGYGISAAMKEHGGLYGAATAGAFLVVLTAISLCMHPRAVGLYVIWQISAVILSGAVGGIIGVNRKEKVKF